MTDDRERSLFRRGLAPLLYGVTAGPDWEELQTGMTQRRGRAGRWIAPVGAAAAVAIFVAFMMLVDDAEPTPTSTGASSFDAVAASEASEEWWLAVIANDLDRARLIAHPEGEFNYVGLRQIVVGLAIEAVSIERRVFGTDLQPQLCYLLTGTYGAERTGSMVFRRHEEQWLLWETRPNVEGCSAGTGLITTTTEPPPSPIVSALPPAPPVPIRVLTVRFNNPSLAVLDFQERTMTVYPPGAHALPLDAVDGAVMTPDGELIIWTQGIARLFTGSLDSVDLVLSPDPLREIGGVAPSIRVVPSPDGAVVWLVQPGIGCCPPSYPTLIELIELPSGRRLASFEADPGTGPVAATTTGLVLNAENLVDTGDGWVTEPGSQRVIHMLKDGTTIDVGAGFAVAANADTIVLWACPSDSPDCQLYRTNELVLVGTDGIDRATIPKPAPGTWFWVGGPGGPSAAMPLQTISPDGSTLLFAIGDELDVNGTPETSTLYTVDLASHQTTAVADFPGRPPGATWSRDGQWIVLIDTRDIELISRTDPENRFTLPNIIPEKHWVLAAG